MKLKRLYENKRFTESNVLNETYTIDQSAIDEVYNIIGTLQQDRGNGPLCQAMCSIATERLGVDINHKKYLVHHLNGYHTDNDYKNLVLIKIRTNGWTHEAIHKNAVRSAISNIMYEIYKFKSGTIITDKDIAGLTPLQQIKLSYLILNMIETGTERKSKNWDKDNGFGKGVIGIKD